MKITLTKNEVIEKFGFPFETDLEISDISEIPDNSEFWTLTDFANEPTSKIIEHARKLFPVYFYDEKDTDKQFPAPEKDIKFSVKKSIEPDEEHRNKSYDDFIAEKNKQYINFRQYLLLFIFVWETENKHLDIAGWTRTSSLWVGGYLVGGHWSEGGSKLYLSSGDRDGRDAGHGPRELFLTL